ncbi:MAG: cysteine peptidase family C39 domain-containing protein [Longimicrobiales bacterium]|nr:cysteine peptidase family C39 domain-containing protein [Longimicrobiales bacterium]
MATLIVRSPQRVAEWGARRALERAGGTFLGWEGVVRQRGLVDCGPAALATLLTLLGVGVPPLDSLAALAGTGPTGTRAGGLARAGSRLGVPLTPRHLDPDTPGAHPAPFIAWVRQSHFVVVAGVDDAGRIHVLDPQAGRFLVDGKAFRRMWSGEAVLSFPDPSSRPATAGRIHPPLF